MRQKGLLTAFLLCIFFSFALYLNASAQNVEAVTLFNYYPSPNGDYETLRVGTIQGRGLLQNDARNSPASPAPCNPRVQGLSTDYLDGYSAEEFASIDYNDQLCSLTPIIEIVGIGQGYICLRRNSFTKNIFYNTVPVVVAGVPIHGAALCCSFNSLEQFPSACPSDASLRSLSCFICRTLVGRGILGAGFDAWCMSCGWGAGGPGPCIFNP
jgi:hypothetical protein